LKERQDLNANITAAINDAAEAWVSLPSAPYAF
jgi:hypothetical protein